MDDNGQKWFATLKKFIVRCRGKQPIPNPESLTIEEDWQRRIIGGAVVGWLNGRMSNILAERSVFCRLKQIEADPYVIITSNTPGLVALREILGDGEARIVFLHGDEFERWSKKHPDPEYKWHIRFWSKFGTPLLPDENPEIVKEHPSPPGSVYWIHEEATMWGSLCGHGVHHLWNWDGQGPTQQKEAYRSWQA